ncbi:alkyl/aryl-sulfatase [Phreatobacter sp.]|uniref:alkyl/aryl-sulfatase n=1 Tax=Phreatobacter sp. TaxID=1966341 RepID=UPI0025D3DCAC|nr:alkyl sulfatase dimerization domain-containing protein [Phreatobacter sp.]
MRTIIAAALAACVIASAAFAQPRDAEPATRAANEAMTRALDFSDRAAFEDAGRGFIAAIPDGTVPGPLPVPAWSMRPYDFLNGAPPATVNPSLWRQAQLNNIHGLFRVTERVYQLRGYDISNMTIVEGDTGLIVIDPLLATETAKAALELYFAHRPRRPVVAVVYTHSHADHFGGVKGIVGDQDVQARRTRIYAPSGFMEHAVSENVIAGNAMSRRAWYQFGSYLEPGPRGQVDTGLGRTLARGTLTLIPPTDLIAREYETHMIDGVEVEFHLTPGTEAPAEMTLFFPQFRVLNMAELANQTMHNLYTIRGAEIRDARAWSRYIQDSLDRYGERTDIVIAQHNWPTFGRERIATYLKAHRDIYKFIHDQTLRLANHGHTPAEIAERLRLPASLAREWSVRGYYGTLSHNAKGVYQRYLGWYDGNPANLSPLPEVEAAKKTVEYMGGATAVIARARADFASGQYRWVASVMNQVVFADPTNREARELGAAALEQLGYQTEAGTWRNAYLMGAMELRSGVPRPPGGAAATSSVNIDMLKAVPLDLLFDFMAVRLNAEKAEGRRIVINWTFTDTNQTFTLNLENATLTNVSGRHAADADAAFTLTRETFDRIITRQRTFPAAIALGEVRFSGNPLKFGELAGLLDEFSPAFPIVEPRPSAP